MRETRPNADELLARVQAEEARQARGRLKVFLGASAGVGKTYAMLSEGQEQRRRGLDVVVGYAESHGRKETDALLDGLFVLPRKVQSHRGVDLEEFDIDGALALKPHLILVDEFAHTNAPGSRHPKRYQDVEELLKAGIDVYTTVNIQHIESLNDVVAQITGVVVRETIPDSVLESADEIELVDIPPRDLQQRLREGKVYIPDRVEHALKGFFREGNLIALRELALRKVADQVDAQMRQYRDQERITGIWPTKNRILVCIAPNRLAGKVVRSAARIGSASHAELIAVSVESDRQTDRAPDELHSGQDALRLAERLGMRLATAVGHDIVGEIVRIAHETNASLIVVGKPLKPKWREFLQGSVVDELVRRSGDIDVYVITGEPEGPSRRRRTGTTQPVAWKSYAMTLLICAVVTGICLALRPSLEPPNLIMIFLLGVTAVASRFGWREAVLASVLSVAAFDFLFVPPFFTFNVHDAQYFLTFGIMLAVALLISGLTLQLRRQATLWRSREQRSSALYRLSSDFAKSRSTSEIAAAGAREIGQILSAEVAIFVRRENSALEVLIKAPSHFEESASEQAVASWVLDKTEIAGAGTDTLPNAAAVYLPLVASRGPVGVLAVKTSSPFEPESIALLETFANNLALALERTLLAKESHQARLLAESEKMRNVLLNSVSHDIRTPLTVIAGAAGALKNRAGDPEELADTIVAQSERLNRHVQNLLDMTRLEAHTVEPKLEWHSVEELVGGALKETESVLKGHKVNTFIPPGMALIMLDGTLVTKALVNLLENAARHTPEGTDIEVRVSLPGNKLRIQVADRGPGIQKGEEERIFDKFYQPGGSNADRGFGLGLAICKSVAQAHGGRVWAENRPGGGARFYIEFSTSGEAPAVPYE